MTELSYALIAVLCALLILSNGRAGYWRGKFEAFEEESGDHCDTFRRRMAFVEHALNAEANKAAHEQEPY